MAEKEETRLIYRTPTALRPGSCTVKQFISDISLTSWPRAEASEDRFKITIRILGQDVFLLKHTSKSELEKRYVDLLENIRSGEEIIEVDLSGLEITAEIVGPTGSSK